MKENGSDCVEMGSGCQEHAMNQRGVMHKYDTTKKKDEGRRNDRKTA